MKLVNSFNTSSPLEIILIIVFILYIIFPIPTPDVIASSVDSSLGILSIFCVTIYLFLYTSPVLGILYILVAYELVRRSALVTARSAIIDYTPTQINKDVEMQRMNPPKQRTLEEDVIDMRAPIGQSPSVEFVDTSFQPVADSTYSGISLI
jgi:hypothetical protein